MTALRIVPDDLFRYLMDGVTGAHFEAFAKQVFAAVFGEEFIPLGGIHDGGADGVLSSYTQEVKGKPTTFIQFSVTREDGGRGKVNDTIQALRNAGRNPSQIIYATSRALPKADLIAQEVFENHAVMVQIRDFERIKGYINSDARANAAFYESFDHQIQSLSRASDLRLTTVSQFAKDPTVYVFLNHELRNRLSQDHLNDRIADALIYWSLRETDPERGSFLSRSEISTAIAAVFPMAKNVLVPRLEERIRELSKKTVGGEERIRHHKPIDKFCLPFDMRRTLASEASSAVLQQNLFRASIRERLQAVLRQGLTEKAADCCVDLVFSTVHHYFVDQGLILAAFLTGQTDGPGISDQIVEDILVKALGESEHGKVVSPEMFGACLQVLRGIFYRWTADERTYLMYLSRTSCLLVTLHSAPKLLEYLNQMAGNFRLLVGSDLLVKALSERYLDREHQQVSNLLFVTKELGAELVLTEPVLSEVFTHLHATDLEFRNHYAAYEQYLKDADGSECDRIMIRAYIHARKNPKGPDSWRRFINQMTDPDGLRSKSESARQALRGFLLQRFGMSFMSFEDLERAVPKAKVDELAARLQAARGAKHEELSYNDALMVYATYAQRRHREESGVYDGFGFRTWWLTKETHVLSLAAHTVQAEGGVPCVMRPEFLLNFVALAPKAVEVRKAFGSLLPTTAGLQLGQYLKPGVMDDLMRDAGDWATLPPERVSAIMSEKINRLRHDRFKRYTENVQ